MKWGHRKACPNSTPKQPNVSLTENQRKKRFKKNMKRGANAAVMLTVTGVSIASVKPAITLGKSAVKALGYI